VSHLIPAKFDVCVIGGGILGSATAGFLLKESPTLSLCVIEPDPTYEFASTLRASGGCRVQFTCPENIAMSLYSIGFIKVFEQAFVSNGRPAPVDWVEGGYLFIVPPDNVANLERNVNRQRAEGCVLDLLTPNTSRSCAPSDTPAPPKLIPVGQVEQDCPKQDPDGVTQWSVLSRPKPALRNMCVISAIIGMDSASEAMRSPTLRHSM
jgi:glycine/D-amino acid oxidase-like deaminating enzyme